MKSLLKVLYTSPIVLTFLSSFPCQLRAAPTISLSLNKDTVSANKIFACELTISWKDDADLPVLQYIPSDDEFFDIQLI